MANNPFGLDTALGVPPSIAITAWPKQTAWSFSAVNNHTKCPQAFRFLRIDRLKEPENDAIVRGKRVHEAFADYLNSGEFPVGMDDELLGLVKLWLPELVKLRERKALPEQQVAFGKDWTRNPEWYGKGVWLRVVLDGLIVEGAEDGDYVEVIEWKTGKPRPEHAQQMRLYALAGLLMFEQAKAAAVRVLYIDCPDAQPVYSALRRSVDRLKKEFTGFSAPLLNDDIYPARPGPNCRWCHYRRMNFGPCQHG